MEISNLNICVTQIKINTALISILHLFWSGLLLFLFSAFRKYLPHHFILLV